MDAHGPPTAPRRAGFRILFAVGMALAVGIVGGLGEIFVRNFPPADSYPYLGERSPLTGPFVANADFGVAYRSWEAFRDANSGRLAAYLPLDHSDGRPTWAMFGSSFVHMQGMLADTVREQLPSVRVFNLGQNEPLLVRLAQARLLLEHGLRPERIFFVLMPLDVDGVGRQPLATVRVTHGGAISFAPRPPPAPLGGLFATSALVRTLWFRTNQHQGDPRFSYLHLHHAVPQRLREDLAHLFGALASTAREYRVPVTLLLIPTHEQLTRGAAFAFQDQLTPVWRGLGLDVCDPRKAFLAYPDKPALFLPDKHFSTVGNRVLFEELLRHLRGQNTATGGAT